MAATIPKKIGKYDVLDVVGKGGMGIVYRAKDPFLDRMVAIKIMTISYADYPDLLQRFYREAKATANLQHPNIVTVYELGEHEGSPYLAMQFLEGASLETILRSGQQLSLLQKIDIIIQACHGLSYAHQRGIVHRDIKPGNIMVLKDESVKIVDFGIARIGDTNFTRTGQFMGSLNYMSLEQLNDKLQVDQRTDVYSTGVVLYQILTGALPFEADSTGATLMKILNDAPPPFSKYLSGYPPELETITIKALAKDRDQRYGSADELALELTQLLDRLKHEKIDVQMQHAERLLQENNLFQANDALMEVLRLDKQHTKAASMLRTLRKQIEKEQSAERARHLREQAEEAFQREDFDPALGYIEQAIHIDTTNVDLQQFRAKIQAAKTEIEHLRQVMQRAENAHRAGNLDTAKQAIEEVLVHRPNDTRVKSLYRMIQKELDERLRQKRMENLIEAARREMSNRRYTAALDILKEAEKVDPEAPALRSLLESLTTARDQEQRRRTLEQLTRQIEQAVNTDDHQSALNLLTDAMKQFPAEPALLKLKDLAESQKQTAQTKSYVRERIAAAREILNAGNAAGAIKVLQDALKKVPGNPHLESLVSLAQERLVQDRDEQAKSRCVQEANEALGRRAYDEAIQLLEAGQLRFTASPEIDNLLRFAREQQAKVARQQDVENSVRRAQEFLRNQEYDQAIALLESILARTPDEELRVVLEEARRRRDDLTRQIGAAIARGQQFITEGSPSKAVEFLEAQPTSFRRSDKFRELLLAAASQNRPPEPQAPVLPEAEFDAPAPQGTMVWDGRMAPPEVQPAPAPRIQTARVVVPPPAKPPVTPTVKSPGLVDRFTKQQKLLAAAVAGAVLLIVIVIAFLPGSKTGTLTVQTNVGGAQLLVKSRSKGNVYSGPEKQITLDEGHYDVQAQKDGYASASGSVDVVKGKDAQLSLELKPVAPEYGTLVLHTNVDAVDVFVDNEPKRTTTGKEIALRLSVGSHNLRVDKKGYDQVPAQTVRIEKEQAVNLPTITLIPTTGTPTYLDIRSKPGARVSVDQKFQDVVHADGTLRLQVKPGTRFLEIRSDDDSFPFAQEETVKQGDNPPIIAPLKLKPKPPTPKPAADIVSFQPDRESVPSGGSVRLSWKINHATNAEITPGIGPVNASSDSKEVTVTANTTYRLTAKGEDGATILKEAKVSVAAAPVAPKVSISANPQTITQGQSTTLTWTSQNADQVTLAPVSGAALSGTQVVTPDKTTKYEFAAKGAGGSDTANVVVTVQPVVPPPPPPPDLKKQVQDALDRLTKSYARQIVADVKQEWTGMTKEQEKVVKAQFESSGMKSLSVAYDSCSNLKADASTATITCTGTTSYTKNNAPQTAGKAQYNISLKKVGDIWRVDTVVYAGK